MHFIYTFATFAKFYFLISACSSGEVSFSILDCFLLILIWCLSQEAFPNMKLGFFSFFLFFCQTEELAVGRDGEPILIHVDNLC